jgi:hypothetical protein
MDMHLLIDRYEKMRAVALCVAGSVPGKQSFGQVVLLKKGVLSWAAACRELHDCTPPPPRAQTVRERTGGEVDLSYELKNVLTLMALSAVEGAGYANVNGV